MKSVTGGVENYEGEEEGSLALFEGSSPFIHLNKAQFLRCCPPQ